jgi:hypothetical protein
MSAQGLNSTSYSGFQYVPVSGSGLPGGFPVRNASDYTKRLKEQSLYREYNGTSLATGSVEPYNNPFVVLVDYSIVQSNETRLSYNFGAVRCRVSCRGPLPRLPVGRS